VKQIEKSKSQPTPASKGLDATSNRTIGNGNPLNLAGGTNSGYWRRFNRVQKNLRYLLLLRF
jgi:hypothetical protein